MNVTGLWAGHHIQLWEGLFHAWWASAGWWGTGEQQKECSQGNCCPGSSTRGVLLIIIHVYLNYSGLIHSGKHKAVVWYLSIFSSSSSSGRAADTLLFVCMLLPDHLVMFPAGANSTRSHNSCWDVSHVLVYGTLIRLVGWQQIYLCQRNPVCDAYAQHTKLFFWNR